MRDTKRKKMKRSLPLRDVAHEYLSSAAGKLDHVVIVGGGIGGLTAGIALKQSNRFESVSIVEKTKLTSNNKQGSGIALWRNSLLAMEQLKVKSDLENKGKYLTNLISYTDGQGNILAKPSEGFSNQFPILCLQRCDLHSVLHNHALQSGVGIEYDNIKDLNDLFSKIKTDPDKTLIVGADGVHSRIRKSITPETPKFMSYRYWRATIPAPEGIDITEAYECWGDGVRFGFVPLHGSEVFWFISEPCVDEYSSEPSVEEKKQSILRLMKRTNMNERTSLLVNSTPASSIIETPIHKVILNGRWGSNNGRVVLLGDACHATAPNLAQGAGLAIEDSIQLAHSYKYEKDSSKASLHYESVRKPRAHTVQFMADTIARLGHMRYPSAKIRDVVLSSCPQFIAGPIFNSAVRYSLGGDYVPPPL